MHIFLFCINLSSVFIKPHLEQFLSNGGFVSDLVRALVNFAGSSASIRASTNVSSVSRNSTGVYTVNFSSALASANYAVSGSSGNSGNNYVFNKWTNGTISSSACQVSSQFTGNSMGDDNQMHAIFVGG